MSSDKQLSIFDLAKKNIRLRSDDLDLVLKDSKSKDLEWKSYYSYRAPASSGKRTKNSDNSLSESRL